MTLAVLNVAFPLVPVSPDTVGGAEQIVAALDRGIVEAGHESFVLAAQGSVTRGTLIPSASWDSQLDESVRAWAAREHRRLISETLRRFPIDVVHLHGLDFFDYLPQEEIPCVATLHLPPEWYSREVFEIARPHTYLNCVSASQSARCPASTLPVKTISHGIDVEAFSTRTRQGSYALTLGRICPEKGFDFAIDAAERANLPLLIGGQVYPYAEHQNYFRQSIKPRLSDRVRFIGPAALRDKCRLLGGASCLLIPSTASETSSLVAMEALAAGTPVIAFRSGALIEIVEHGKTGFLVSNAGEMAEAIRRACDISPEACRKAARSRFPVDRMVQQYLHLYAEMSACFHGCTRAVAS